MQNSIDLTNCDREQIHLVGAIQPHGFFLAYSPADETVQHASANIERLVGAKANEVCGRMIAGVLGEREASILRRSVREVLEGASNVETVASLAGQSGPFDIYVFNFDGLVGLEIERRDLAAEESAAERVNVRRLGQSYVDDLHTSGSLEQVAKLTCKVIRSIIGFDRVMMYRYLPNWDGEVIAEDKSPEAHSFLQHRFPASDIPLPARTLYLRNRTRQIVDSSADSTEIVPQAHYLTRKPIDLSSSKLRAVSPIHMQYLRNMNVQSSFSVAVVVDGELWGLIACHGSKPSVIPLESRLACESIAATFSLVANMKEQLGQQSERLLFHDRMRALFAKIIQTRGLLSELLKRHAEVETMFGAAGVALVTREGVQIAGLTPPADHVLRLADELKKRFRTEHKTILALDNLALLGEEFGNLKEMACGILSVYAPLSDDAVFMIFRPEAIRTIVWGGDPKKTLERRGYDGQINPRLSFESWRQTVGGHSKSWATYEIKGAEFFRDFVLTSLLKKEILIDELAKQLKN